MPKYHHKHIRLPKYIKPERYRIMVKPDLEGFVFFGEETIYLKLERSTKEITLHANGLEIFDVSCHVLGIRYQAKDIRFNQKTETATFVFDKKLHQGRGELSLKFKGILNDTMRGFYRSRYYYKGKEKYLATTQFEATDARRAFPCFDEPHQKAIFDITLMIPPGTTAISNTIETSIEEHESGYWVVQFAPTPKMSTYLVAFMVGEFEYIEKKSRNGVLVRIFVTPGKKHQAKFALDCAARMLEFYEKYFNIPYPLPVLDLIAIPDFDHGAMENWGAITSRESALLVDEKHSSAANKQWVALVIAHELAHQWFGNLVTMQWWTHLWLNEGFASYVEYLAVDHLFPKWDIWTQFAYNDLGVALRLDALKNTHPIEIPVHHPREIDEIFDEVTYSKGACVIRMLASFLGEKDFRTGLRHYLKKHAYKNATTEDLWHAFEIVSKKPVAKMMKNWTSRSGYPLIRLIEQKKDFLLAQSRFYSSRVVRKQSLDSILWQVPLKIQNSRFKIQDFFLKDKTILIPKSKVEWIKLNSGESGFLRIDYPAQILQKLKNPIKAKKLPAIDRLGIIRDAFALAESGQLPTTLALHLAYAYKKENDYAVWVELIASLNQIANLIRGEFFYNLYEKYCQIILKKIARKLGWQGNQHEPHTNKLLRSLVLYHLGNFGDETTVERAQKIFKSGRISSDVRGAVYPLLAENGSFREHRKFIKMYQQANLHEEKNRIGRALGHFRNKELLKRTLEFSISKHVRSQDAPSIIIQVWSNYYGKDLAWSFVKKHWSRLLHHYGEGSHLLQKILKTAGLFTTQSQADDITRFFRQHETPAVKRTTQQVLEKINSNVAWLKSQKKAIGNWLTKQN